MTQIKTTLSSDQIRSLINEFLQERLKPKLDKLKEGEDEKRQKLIEAHQLCTWIADAARRVSQIQRVTHALKFSHPEAKGSSLYSRGALDAGDTLIGTHSLLDPVADVVGNAAALDVYKFLRLEVDGTSLLELAQNDSAALYDAFGEDDAAREWMAAFAGIDQPKGTPASHKLAKQLYWPLESEGYRLLAPLFPSSLVQAQYERLREDRFGDAAKAARNARFEDKAFEHGYREHPNLAIVKFGGTKPQNISQLNSERHGEAWLLASVPPTWKSAGLKPPCHVDSIFGRWLMGFRTVREPVFILRNFLRKTAHNNLAIRNTRADLARQIIDEVLMLVSSIQKLPAGWSANEDCRLNRDEAFWLDGGRAIEDTGFAAARKAADWKKAVAQGFGRWLNHQLDSDKSPMSDPERQHWRDTLDKELRLLREELDHV